MSIKKQQKKNQQKTKQNKQKNKKKKQKNKKQKQARPWISTYSSKILSLSNQVMLYIW